eukprot:1128622-Prorocentrum_minimum.AAC.3
MIMLKSILRRRHTVTRPALTLVAFSVVAFAQTPFERHPRRSNTGNRRSLRSALLHHRIIQSDAAPDNKRTDEAQTDWRARLASGTGCTTADLFDGRSAAEGAAPTGDVPRRSTSSTSAGGFSDMLREQLADVEFASPEDQQKMKQLLAMFAAEIVRKCARRSSGSASVQHQHQHQQRDVDESAGDGATTFFLQGGASGVLQLGALRCASHCVASRAHPVSGARQCECGLLTCVGFFLTASRHRDAFTAASHPPLRQPRLRAGAAGGV